MNEPNYNQIEEMKFQNIFINEINALVNNAKEIEKKLLDQSQKDDISNNINNNIPPKTIEFNNNIEYNKKNNNDNTNKKVLEREFRGLKYILGTLEKNYNFISPYHEQIDISFKNEENMTEEISNQIINLYISKNFNKCYNLWKKYDFKMLIGVCPERSFDMLKYLNKIRDRYENRKHIIESINKIDLSSLENNNINQSAYYSNYDNISNIKNNSQLTSSDIYNLKLNENEQFAHKLRRQIDSIKRMHNITK